MATSAKPMAPIIPYIMVNHGDTRVDNYHWLKNRDNPAVIKYLEQENQYLKSRESIGSLKDSIFEEITSKIVKDDDSVPYVKVYQGTEYVFKHTYSGDSEYPVYWRGIVVISDDGKEKCRRYRKVLDVNELSVGQSFTQVKGLVYSSDGTTLAYGIDTTGRRKYDIRFKDLETDALFPDRLENTSGQFIFGATKDMGYYVLLDDSLRPYKIMSHVVGTSQEMDICIYHETDERFWVIVAKTEGDEYMIIGSASQISSEFRVLDLRTYGSQWEIISLRRDGVEYTIGYDPSRDVFLIRTNLDAINFRLMETSKLSKERRGQTGWSDWKEVIPHRESVLLEDFEVFQNYLVLQERSDGQVKLRVIDFPEWIRDTFDLKSTQSHYINFDEEIYDVWTCSNYVYSTNVLRIGYGSLTTPQSTFDYNMDNQQSTLLKEKTILNFNKNNYESRKFITQTHDDKDLTISLLYNKSIADTPGPHPCVVYGYGSYGLNIDPYLGLWRLPLLDRGFIFAIIHVRGSQYYGRQWYEDGKMHNKMNTFRDFISGSEALISSGLTCPDRLFAIGGSAGGLLVSSTLR